MAREVTRESDAAATGTLPACCQDAAERMADCGARMEEMMAHCGPIMKKMMAGFGAETSQDAASAEGKQQTQE